MVSLSCFYFDPIVNHNVGNMSFIFSDLFLANIT